MSITEKLTTIAENQQKVYDAGFASAEAICSQKHYVTTVTGNGMTSIGFHVPFRPDALLVFVSEVGMYGNTAMDSGFLAMAQFDPAGFGMIGGRYTCFFSSGEKLTLVTTTSMLSRYSRSDDGTVTLGNLLFNNGSATVPAAFIDGAEYVIVAVKYAEKSDKERITEYIHSLSDSGSTTLNRAKVSAAFTDDEWAALIAEKPDWTFSFI